mgnify:CR=1 FL=1
MNSNMKGLEKYLTKKVYYILSIQKNVLNLHSKKEWYPDRVAR